MKKLVLLLASAIVAATAVQADEVVPKQAETAVGNWLRLGSRRMDAAFSSRDAESVKTVRGKTGRAVYHAVNIKGGGFVVTSGDTRLPPIIAFSGRGRFADDGNGAFHALLSKSLGRAVDALERSDHQAAALSGGARKGEDPLAAPAEWAELLSPSDDRQARVGGSRATALSDVRVDRLLKTEWGQSGISIWNWSDTIDDWEETYYPSFDYYTPNNYPCGCVATVGAQIMKYWQMPSGDVPLFSNTCIVNGTSVERDSIPGAFDWGSMYLKWDHDDPIPDEKAREAVGKLTYNVAVALGMKWGEEFGSSSPDDLVEALKDKFSYASGTFVWHDIAAFDKTDATTPDDFADRMADFYNGLYASLDARMPVVMSIDGDFGGHCIVADGYGYTAGKRYTHLNFGWYGRDDAWYYLPEEKLLVSEDEEDYTVFEGIGFNIHPTTAGDVLSGRVVDANGAAVSNAAVELYDAEDNRMAATASDARGIYSFRITAIGDYTVRALHSAAEDAPSNSVSVVAMSRSGSFSADTDGLMPWAGRSGNKWGVDLRFPVAIPSASEGFTVTFDPNGGSVTASSVKVPAGDAIGSALPVATRIGHDFIGWKIDESNWVEESTVVTADIHCQAMWWPQNYTVTLDPCGGEIDYASFDVTYGEKYVSIPSPLKSNSTFAGWFTAKEGGEQIKLFDTVAITEDTTLYAHWNSGTDPVTPDPVTPDPVTPDPVTPDPVTPDPGACYTVLRASDIKEAYSAPKAMVLRGAVYYRCDVVGIVELKLGKVSNGKSKISGSFTGLDGKKVTLKAAPVTGIDGRSPVSVSFAVKGYSTLNLTIGGTRFAGSLGSNWHVQSANVGGNWTKGAATVSVDVGGLSMFPGTVLKKLLPQGERAAAGGKWMFAKAAGVKWAKPKQGTPQPEIYDAASGKGLVVDTSGGKTNLSGMKLTYTPKKGTFKGAFKLYALEGTGKATKLRKYKVNVTGVVVDGVGSGRATCRRPAANWAVTVE